MANKADLVFSNTRPDLSLVFMIGPSLVKPPPLQPECAPVSSDMCYAKKCWHVLWLFVDSLGLLMFVNTANLWKTRPKEK